MDYLKSLVELIKSKKEISGDALICITLREIADIWNRNVVKSYAYRRPHLYASEEMIEANQAVKETIGDHAFLEDIISCIKTLRKKGEIEFISILEKEKFLSKNKISSPENIIYLNSPKDKIYLRLLKKNENIITLYLTRDGDLYREPKEKNCYPIKENSKRHKIIKYFSENNIYKFCPTKQIAIDLEQQTEELRKKIGELNQIIFGKLNIKDKILEAKKDSGYRINPKYKIISK